MTSLKRPILKAVFVLFTATSIIVTHKTLALQADPFALVKSDAFKLVRSLVGKHGEFLGYVYVKENPKYTNHVLLSLLVLKNHGSKLDTLYQIKANGDFVNSKGEIELKNPPDHNYCGFKLYAEKKNYRDIFSVGEVDRKGAFFADDNHYLIDWEYATQKFMYYPAP